MNEVMLRLATGAGMGLVANFGGDAVRAVARRVGAEKTTEGFVRLCKDLNISKETGETVAGNLDGIVDKRKFDDIWEKVFGKGVKQAGSVDDLVSWASKNGLSNLTQAEIKGTFDLFDGNITFAQKALLSSKEIVAGKTLPEIAQHFNLPIIPTAKSLTPYQARVWYSWRKSQISTLVNRSNGLEEAAREAVEMRNTIRTTTRTSMKDVDIADFLNTKEVNKTFETMYNEKSLLFTNQDDIYNAIIESSMKGRDGVDVLYKIPK